MSIDHNNSIKADEIPENNGKLVLVFYKQELLSWLQIVLLILPHFNPPFFNTLGFWGSIIDGFRLISAFVTIFLIVIYKVVPSKVTFMIITQNVYMLIITFINGGLIKDTLLESGSIITILLLYEIFLQKYSWTIFISALLFCFEVMLYINHITIIMFPDGMYMTNAFHETFFLSGKCWFLGYYNNLTMYIIPAYMFALLYVEETGRKIRSCLLILSIATSALLLKSGGVILSIISITLIWIFFKNMTVIFNYFNYWISQVFFVVIVLTIGINLKSKVVTFVLGELLGKINSFEGRIRLWGRYIIEILREPLLGYGMSNMDVRQQISRANWGTHAHNLVLEILYRGGIINIILWVVIVIIAGKNIYKYKNNRLCMVVATCFAGWCLDSFVEPFTSLFLMGMFVIAYYVGLSAEEDEKYYII